MNENSQKKLYDFLRKNKCLGSYIKNFKKNILESAGLSLRSYKIFNGLKKTSPELAISCAFSWDDTEEGFEFWERIYNKWYISLNDDERREI